MPVLAVMAFMPVMAVMAAMVILNAMAIMALMAIIAILPFLTSLDCHYFGFQGSPLLFLSHGDEYPEHPVDYQEMNANIMGSSDVSC